MGYTRGPDKSVAVTYLLWLTLGWFGVHHFYLGKYGRGYRLPPHIRMVHDRWWVDLFTLPAQVKRINFERRTGFR